MFCTNTGKINFHPKTGLFLENNAIFPR